MSGYLGTTTNNVAEYSGLLEALEIALAEGASELDVISDSLLLFECVLTKHITATTISCIDNGSELKVELEKGS